RGPADARRPEGQPGDRRPLDDRGGGAKASGPCKRVMARAAPDEVAVAVRPRPGPPGRGRGEGNGAGIRIGVTTHRRVGALNLALSPGTGERGPEADRTAAGDERLCRHQRGE